jgi:hypothetical protein
VNVFEDMVWFNKESFEEALLYAPLVAALESGAALEGVARPPKKAASKTTAAASATADLPTPLPDAGWLDRAAKIGALAEAFAKAEEQSGYQLDGLLGALAEKPKTRGSVGKK